MAKSKVEPGLYRAKVGRPVYIKPLIVRVKSYLYAKTRTIEDPDNDEMVIRADIWLTNGGGAGGYYGSSVRTIYHPLCKIDPEAREILTKDGKFEIKATNLDEVINMILESLANE